MTESPCAFCDADSMGELIASSMSSSVVASFGMLVEGWLLVVPSRHVTSLAQLSDHEWDDARQLARRARKLVADEYGVQPITFEHGAAGTGRPAGCGIDHAHLHVVPLDMDVRSQLAKVDGDAHAGEWMKISNRPRHLDGYDYLWVADATGSWVRYSDHQPSQVVRRAIAHDLGQSVWDWKQDLRMDLVDLTVTRLLHNRPLLAS